jgi:hypothetical protein
MNTIRRTLDLDAATDARLRALVAERGQDEAAVLAEAIALLDSVVEIDAPDIAGSRAGVAIRNCRRLRRAGLDDQRNEKAG